MARLSCPCAARRVLLKADWRQGLLGGVGNLLAAEQGIYYRHYRHHDGIDMIRMQVQFSEEQVQLLKARAAEEHVSISEIVRRAVSAWSTSQSGIPANERRRRAIGIVGRFASGLKDVAARPDDYPADAYRS